MILPNNITQPLNSWGNNQTWIIDTLIDNLEGMVYCCLIDPNWTMVYVSKGSEVLTGYSADKLIFNELISYEEITYEDDRALVRSKISEAIKQHSKFEIEYRICHADGRVLWVCERGGPIYNAQYKAQAIEGYIQNITAQKNAEQSLRITEARYRSIFENAIEGIFQTTPNGQYLIANPALARMYGYKTPNSLISALNNIDHLYVLPTRRHDFIEMMAKHGSVQNFESQVYREDKSIIWISENARMVHDESGNLLFYEGTVEDITNRKNYEEKMQYQAMHDSLTGLPNRYMLNDRLQQSINFAERYQNKFAVAFLDLDQFKLINDSMGHDVGDLLLVTISERLTHCMRDTDTVARLGGDEFLILLSNIDQFDDIKLCIERMLAAVSEPCFIKGWDFVVSCSIGISIFPDNGKNASTLLKNADSALHKAKQSGRNQYQVYTHELGSAMTERIKMEYKLRHAIEHQEFLLHYQPKVNFITGKICGAEALIRWQPLGKELIPPIKFIQIAEETGLIEPIGEWVLLTACQQAKMLQIKTGLPISIAINVSSRQFRQSNLADTIKSALHTTSLEPHYLELEITESLLADNPRKFIETLHTLKNIGVKLSIDDFGTGYSSLAYLKDFPIDRLKIDKAFVSNLEDEPSNSAILKAIIVLGHSLGIKVIAEGVETAYQYQFLQEIGCDELQGYYFSKPLPLENFEALLLNSQSPKCLVKTKLHGAFS